MQGFRRAITRGRGLMGVTLGGLLMLCSGLYAQAAPVTFNFSGTLIAVDPALAGTFSAGQALTGSYTFESTTLPRPGGNANSAVYDALSDVNFTLGSYSASSTGAPEIQVDNNPGLPFHDRYALVARASDGLTGPTVGSSTLSAFGSRLDDSTDTVFSTALALPTNLSLTDFDSNAFFLFFTGPQAEFQLLSGTLTELTPVPEPS